jgi:DNA polymerase III subunit delta'
MATDREHTAAPELAVDAQGRWPLPWLKPWVSQLVHPRGHGLLLHLAPGQGAVYLAVCLAQAWLCESRAEDGHACRRCGSCHALQGRFHPDLLLLMPEDQRRELQWPLQGDKAEGADAGAGEGGKASKKPSRQLRIEEVRQAAGWVAATNSRGQGKVLALHPATAMNVHAANALLKTLEEPPQGVRIVLTAADPQRLLPTVRSRCQLVQPAPPARAVLLHWLEAQGVADAEVLLDAAGGLALTAWQWSRAGLTSKVWAELPRALMQGRAEAFTGWPLAQAIEVLQRLCHDSLRRSVGGEGRFFPSQSLHNGQDVGRLVQWQRSLNRAARHDEHPWQEALLLEALVDEGRRAYSH